MTGKKIVVDRKFVLPKNFWPNIFDERNNIKNSNLKNTLAVKSLCLKIQSVGLAVLRPLFKTALYGRYAQVNRQGPQPIKVLRDYRNFHSAMNLPINIIFRVPL